MKLLFFIGSLFLISGAYSQTGASKVNDTLPGGYVNGLAIKSITSRYAVISVDELFGTTSTLSNITFDYGQQNGDKRIKDKSGERISFKSLAQLLNYLEEYGWSFIDKISSQSNSKIIQLIFKHR